MNRAAHVEHTALKRHGLPALPRMLEAMVCEQELVFQSAEGKGQLRKTEAMGMQVPYGRPIIWRA